MPQLARWMLKARESTDFLFPAVGRTAGRSQPMRREIHRETASFPFAQHIYAMQPLQISGQSLVQGKTTLRRKRPT